MWLNILEPFFVFLWGNFSSGRWSFFLPGRVCRASLSASFNELKLDRALSKTNWGFKMISWKDNTHFKIIEFKVMTNETCKWGKISNCTAKHNPLPCFILSKLFTLISFCCLLSSSHLLFPFLQTRQESQRCRKTQSAPSNSMCAPALTVTATHWLCNVRCYWLHF